MVVNSSSRWDNHYLEGLDWLVQNVGIDGVYIDDFSFDRTVMRRARKILDRGRPGSLIDLHSWNHFNDRAGFANCANIYLDCLPYVDRIWFGEEFNYNEAPDYWLVELSGIPFGLMGEMLQDGGNPWRGMLFGMTGRYPYMSDPRPLWRLFDQFGIQQTEMIGYWTADCPAKTDHPQVLATVYRKPGKTLIALASCAPETVECQLTIDFEALGLSSETASLRAPAVENFQGEATFRPADPIPVDPARGWLLVVEGER